MANMADDKTEGTQEMAKEQLVLSTGEAAGTPSPVAKGVDLDTVIRLLAQTRDHRTTGSAGHRRESAASSTAIASNE